MTTRPIRPVFDYEAEVNRCQVERRHEIIAKITNVLWCAGCIGWVVALAIAVASWCAK